MRTVTWRQVASAGVLALAGLAVLSSTAQAQITRVSRSEPRQAVSFNVGGFFLTGESSRDADDVIFTNLEAFDFQVKDFNGATFGGEWLIGAGDYLEAGVGVGYYQRTVPSVYRAYQNVDGSEIAQDFKLRVIPFGATLRFLPIGRGRAVEPYIGAGVGIFNWRYTETGDFISFEEGSIIFSGRFAASGNAVGPLILAGARFPIGDVFTVGGELRWQMAKGDIDPSIGIPATKIDLGGLNALFNFNVRF